VDRAKFTPARIWFDDEHGRTQPVDRDREPDRWRSAVYSDEPIVTQLDDDATVWLATSNAATSSTSQPAWCCPCWTRWTSSMDTKVLEIGTGTGYNTALLAHRLGEHLVTSIEVDETLAEQARTNLAAAGYAPTVVCADGAAGWPDNASYDRILGTAAVVAGRLPYA
jgi:protein-L-isoaspartate O-methyltransferase